MPDPASRCPFFDRLSKWSKQNPQEVCDALTICPPADFIGVGVAYGVIDPSEIWNCNCNGTNDPVDEEKYLRKYWFSPEDSWWKDHTKFSAWENLFNARFHSATVKSCARYKKTGNAVPIEGLWVCYGNELDVLVPQVTGTPPNEYVMIMVLTPPPGCECTNPNHP
jgi:hypothetical protein